MLPVICRDREERASSMHCFFQPPAPERSHHRLGRSRVGYQRGEDALHNIFPGVNQQKQKLIESAWFCAFPFHAGNLFITAALELMKPHSILVRYVRNVQRSFHPPLTCSHLCGGTHWLLLVAHSNATVPFRTER